MPTAVVCVEMGCGVGVVVVGPLSIFVFACGGLSLVVVVEVVIGGVS